MLKINNPFKSNVLPSWWVYPAAMLVGWFAYVIDSQLKQPTVKQSYSIIERANCVQSKYWICDLVIDGEVFLGYRSAKEIVVGDKMILIKRDGRTYVFPK